MNGAKECYRFRYITQPDEKLDVLGLGLSLFSEDLLSKE